MQVNPLEGPPGGLYVVVRKNAAGLPKSSFVYLDDDGFQKVHLIRRGRQQGGESRGPKWKIKRMQDSPLIPYEVLKDAVIRVEKPRERPE